jgi:cytochrome oxidase assembly protein ShyY1
MYCTSPIILYLAVPAIASLLGKWQIPQAG